MPTGQKFRFFSIIINLISRSRPLGPQESEDGTTDNVEKFLCNVCNKLIPENYRTIHQNSHKSSNKMNCDICNKKFLSKENLEMHMGVHNLDKVMYTLYTAVRIKMFIVCGLPPTGRSEPSLHWNVYRGRN